MRHMKNYKLKIPRGPHSIIIYQKQQTNNLNGYETSLSVNHRVLFVNSY